jgi:hypothetical protein
MVLLIAGGGSNTDRIQVFSLKKSFQLSTAGFSRAQSLYAA